MTTSTGRLTGYSFAIYPSTPLQYPCPTCAAKEGQQCRIRGYSQWHTERDQLFATAYEEARSHNIEILVAVENHELHRRGQQAADQAHDEWRRIVNALHDASRAMRQELEAMSGHDQQVADSAVPVLCRAQSPDEDPCSKPRGHKSHWHQGVTPGAKQRTRRWEGGVRSRPSWEHVDDGEMSLADWMTWGKHR